MNRSRASLPVWQRRLFASGSPALDLCHTGGVLGYPDLVLDADSAAFWLSLLLERPVRTVEADVAPIRDLRAAHWEIAQRHLRGQRYRATDVRRVNAAAAGPVMPLRLRADGSAEAPYATGAQALAHLGRTAIELFTGALRGRVRECSSPDCRLLFVDASRPGRRQWCSMARCGNLAKTRAYRARTR